MDRAEMRTDASVANPAARRGQFTRGCNATARGPGRIGGGKGASIGGGKGAKAEKVPPRRKRCQGGKGAKGGKGARNR